MKLSLSWIKEFLDTDASFESVYEALNSCGLVIDGVSNIGPSIAHFKIAHIVSVEPHPNADRLKVCMVDTDSGTIQVVCGAPNARSGLKVVLGRPGDYVPGLHITLKEAQVRSVDSLGMMCSFSELGLVGDGSSGIIELPDDAPIGVSFVEYMGLDDPVFDIDITPNRGDCLSAYGVARDLHAKGIGQLRIPHINPVAPSFQSGFSLKYAEFCDELSQACPFFSGRVIRGVRNGPSPRWLKDQLQKIGLKSISALVDVTNYMAYHLGRPMHVFDFDKIKGGLQVRFAQDGEKIKALDDQEYTLAKEMLVIADEAEAISIAGIMGGLESGCSMDTVNVFLESAYFDPISIARTGRALGIISDSRYRFERGVDPAMVSPALDFATQMIIDLCGGEVSEIIAIGDISWKNINKKIDFPIDLIRSFGGMPMDDCEMFFVLERLGFGVHKKSSDVLELHVPSWRHDISGAHDIVEEVLRIKGYDNIPSVDMPPVKSEEIYQLPESVLFRHNNGWISRRALASRGYHEVLTWSFMKKEHASFFEDVKEEMILLNPISVDLSTMRPSLMGNLASAMQRNKDRGNIPGGLFEVGLEYHDTSLNGQKWVICGLRPSYGEARHWSRNQKGFSVYDVKSDIYALLKAFGLSKNGFEFDGLRLESSAPHYYHPGQSAKLVNIQSGEDVCVFGSLHPALYEELRVDGPLCGFELYLDALPMALCYKAQKDPYSPSAYQSVRRDLAFVVDENVSAQDIITAAKSCIGSEIITDIVIFDVYKGAGIPDGKKSIAFYYVMEPISGTLTDAQIHETMQSIIVSVEKSTKGCLR